MRTFAIAGLVAMLMVTQFEAFAACPDGFENLGQLYFSTDAENGRDTKMVKLPVNFVPDTSYQQTTGFRPSGGGSDTHSDATVSDVPRGFYLIASGSESQCKGWAVLKPIKLTVEDLDGATVKQFGFSAPFYCTRGSGEHCKGQGGCDARLDICGKRKK